MPHDVKGQEIHVGDLVTIACTVKEIYTGTEFCNVQLETVEPMYPEVYPTTITLNTKQVNSRMQDNAEKVELL